MDGQAFWLTIRLSALVAAACQTFVPLVERPLAASAAACALRMPASSASDFTRRLAATAAWTLARAPWGAGATPFGAWRLVTLPLAMPIPTSAATSSGGSSAAQMSAARGQRVLNRQPLGISLGFGGSPSRENSRASRCSPMRGIAASSDCV